MGQDRDGATGARKFGDTVEDLTHDGQVPQTPLPLADSQGQRIVRAGDASGPVPGVSISDEPRRTVAEKLGQQIGGVGEAEG